MRVRRVELRVPHPFLIIGCSSDCCIVACCTHCAGCIYIPEQDTVSVLHQHVANSTPPALHSTLHSTLTPQRDMLNYGVSLLSVSQENIVNLYRVMNSRQTPETKDTHPSSCQTHAGDKRRRRCHPAKLPSILCCATLAKNRQKPLALGALLLLLLLPPAALSGQAASPRHDKP